MPSYGSGNGRAAHESLLEKARRCFKLACESEEGQRQREREDLLFQIPENQWTEAARNERAGGNGVPPRPMLSISKIDQPMQLVRNQAAAAKLGVNIRPVSEKANKETAEALQGLYRRIEQDSNADQARMWAFQRAVVAGRGWYRVSSKWDEDSDPTYFDQEIVIERILHQESVYVDPSSQKPDFSDGEWAFVASWVPIERFKELYPDAKTNPMEPLLWDGYVQQIPEWVRVDGSQKAMLVCEYYYKEHEEEEIKFGDRVRKRDKVTVKWAKLAGEDVLDEEQLEGQYIPLIPVLGRELLPVDGERRWIGMVRNARDAQRFFNFAASSMVERMAMEPKSPWVMAEGQDEGHESEWLESNIRNKPVLHYKPVALGDKQAPPPARAQIDLTGMSLSMQGLQVSDEWIQANTSVFDQSLGKSKRDESGRRILALQGQSDAATSDYLNGMATVSLPYEARVILDLIPAKYDRPGRITQILGGEDEPKTIMINAPYMMDQDGRPQPAPNQPGAKVYDFTTRGYSTDVSIGKSFQTRLQQGQEAWSELLPNLPPEAQVLLLPTFMRFMDTPGAQEAADLMAKFRDSKFPGLVNDDDQQPTPEQMQAQLQAMGQQMQLMQANLQAAVKQIETDQAKQQATLMKAQMDNQTKIALAEIQQQTDAKEDALKVSLERMQQQFEAMQNALDRALELKLHHEEMAHEVAMAHAGGTSMEFSKEGGREEGAESGNGEAEA